MVIVEMPGTCGELMQGILGGQPFLVTCPVDRWARAVAKPDPALKEWMLPPGHEKAQAAVKRAVELHWPNRAGTGGRISVWTELPRGKGMASSTADIVCAVAAVGCVHGDPLYPGELAQIASSIEPTDGTMFPGVVIFDHMRGKIIRSLGLPPPISLLLFDMGGTVDTLAYHALVREAEGGDRLKLALDLLTIGFERGDPALIGKAATISALMHQKELPKTGLEQLWEDVSSLGGLGICVAHSGTVFGVMGDPSWLSFSVEDKLNRLVAQVMPGTVPIGRARLISGGVRLNAAHLRLRDASGGAEPRVARQVLNP